MKAIFILLWVPLTIFGFSSTPDLRWGATGHRVVGEYAAQRISKRTAKKIDALLDGVSLAETSTLYFSKLNIMNTFSQTSTQIY